MAKYLFKTKLNDRVRRVICDAIRDGNYVQTAVAKGGIHLQTHYGWTQRGQAEIDRCHAEGCDPDPDELIYVKYVVALEQARADCEDAAIQSWENKIPDDWRAARDFLARRFPERWGNREVVEVHQPDVTAILNTALERIYGPDSNTED